MLSVLPLLLLGQLVHVQVFDHEYYLKRSKEAISQIEMQRPLRGRIKSRSGKILARNQRQYDLYIIPAYVEDRTQLFQNISDLTGSRTKALEERYQEITGKIEAYANRVENEEEQKKIYAERYKQRRRRSARRSPHLLSKYLSFEEVIEIKTNRSAFKGTMVKGRPTRTYPYGRFAGHVTGYVAKYSEERTKDGIPEIDWMLKNYYQKYLLPHIGDDFFTRLKWRGAFREGQIGRSGVEKSFDMMLRGKPGATLIERNLVSGNSEVHQNVVPENGKDLRLSVDIDIQRKALQILRHQKIRGAFVLLDVDTYEVLAAAANPTYDPNRLVSPVTRQAVEKILGGGGPTLFNRVISGQYPPGSAFKTLVAMAGMKTGSISSRTRINCTGQYQYGDNVWKCWIYDTTGSGHGELTVAGALKHSCNYFFYETGRRIGGRTLKEWARKFEFGQKTGIRLPAEASGNMFQSREVINAAIGQGSLTVSPLQMTRLIAFVAGGNPYKTPTILKNPDHSQNPKRIPVDREILQSIREGMFKVVNERKGTAHRQKTKMLYSGELGYQVAGKTSTAQIGGDREPHAWFVGFAPYENPEVAFALIYEHGGSGGGNAAPVAGQILNSVKLPFQQTDDQSASDQKD